MTLAFGLSALALSAAFASISYGVTRSNLVRQREQTALRQAFVNASLLRTELRSARADLPRVLASLDMSAGTQSVLYRAGEWAAPSLAIGRDALPPRLRTEVIGGAAARQRFRLEGVPMLAVGVPIAAVDSAYFEVFSLAELERTLDTFAGVLLVAAGLTTVAGVVIGRWISGRVLRPLVTVSHAAAAIAGGQLATRLEGGSDRELATLVTSFNRMADNLQARLERDARFASDVSHELRSPLTTLATAVGVLEGRRHELSERGQIALDLLAAEVRRFERLVGDLLEISRLDAGAVELSFEYVRLAELVTHSTPNRFPVEVDGAVADAVVRADKRRLERVIVNLCENADAYGGGVVRVAVERGATVDRARVSVEDAGPGVPVDERDKIFDRFFRGSASGRRASGEGTGLGLALVAEHVNHHGGRVWVEDRRGGGARFVVELPVVAT